MNRARHFIFWLSLFVLVGGSLVVIFLLKNTPTPSTSYVSIREIPEELPISIPTSQATATATHRKIYFTGDLMLARHVEVLMEQHGSDYPYRKINNLFQGHPVITNFEAAIPQVHVKTPSFTFQFSVAKKHLLAFNQAGFTHASLANNHALDYGAEDYHHTYETLENYGITAFGHPSTITASSVIALQIGSTTIGILGLHSVWSGPELTLLEETLNEMNKQYEVVIVYVHWGEEYTPFPTVKQESLAKALADFGTDLIIGHHPHVTQLVDQIGDTIVFYSLGNFIFDQYFSSDVRQGMVLELGKLDDELRIAIIPVTSEDTRAQPRKMTDVEAFKFLSRLSTISNPIIKSQLERGIITLPSTLATSTETAIMNQ